MHPPVDPPRKTRGPWQKTGARRFRASLIRGILILQVEEKLETQDWPRLHTDYRWRDARADDVTLEEYRYGAWSE